MVLNFVKSQGEPGGDGELEPALLILYMLLLRLKKSTMMMAFQTSILSSAPNFPSSRINSLSIINDDSAFPSSVQHSNIRAHDFFLALPIPSSSWATIVHLYVRDPAADSYSFTHPAHPLQLLFTQLTLTYANEKSHSARCTNIHRRSHSHFSVPSPIPLACTWTQIRWFA